MPCTCIARVDAARASFALTATPSPRDALFPPSLPPPQSPPRVLSMHTKMPHVTYASCGLPEPSIDDRTFVCALCPQRLYLKYAVSGQHPNQYYLKVCCILNFSISPCLISAYTAL